MRRVGFDLTDGRILSDVMGYVESRRFDNEVLNVYFVVGEDARFVYFANVYGFEWTEEERELGESRFVQVETAVLNKESSEIFHMIDNDGIGLLGKLNGLSYVEYGDLIERGFRFVRDPGNMDLSWLDFVK